MPTLTANGVEIAYTEEGDGEPLIFLHGLGISRADWQYQIEFFREKYCVLAPDFRGHGESEKPDCHYNIPQHASDILAFMDALHINSAHVVGLSMGGMVAFQLAVDAPERLRTMTIVNSGPARPNDTFAAKRMLWIRLLTIHLLGMKFFAKKVAENMFVSDDVEAEIESLVAQIASNPKRIYLRNLKSLWGWGVLPQLSQIEIPTLMLTGDQDYSPISAKQAVVNAMQNAKLVVVKGSGHGTPIEKPEETNRAIDEFISAYLVHG